MEEDGRSDVKCRVDRSNWYWLTCWNMGLSFCGHIGINFELCWAVWRFSKGWWKVLDIKWQTKSGNFCVEVDWSHPRAVSNSVKYTLPENKEVEALHGREWIHPIYNMGRQSCHITVKLVIAPRFSCTVLFCTLDVAYGRINRSYNWCSGMIRTNN